MILCHAILSEEDYEVSKPTFVYLRLNSVGGYLDASEEDGARDIFPLFLSFPQLHLISGLSVSTQLPPPLPVSATARGLSLEKGSREGGFRRRRRRRFQLLRKDRSLSIHPHCPRFGSALLQRQHHRKGILAVLLFSSGPDQVLQLRGSVKPRGAWLFLAAANSISSSPEIHQPQSLK